LNARLEKYILKNELYINGLIDDFDHSCSPVLLGQKHISCLLYADDLHEGVLKTGQNE
jgi:hypothetical protein